MDIILKFLLFISFSSFSPLAGSQNSTKSCQLNLSDVVIKSNPPIDDGISYQNGTKIICSCPQGSTLKGDDSFVCLYGNWTYDEEPSCEPNTATSFFQSGNILLYLALQTILARMISSNVLN
ncbi:uncharacterized protein [Apostichopus japonicus]|uniref:uncharacterized protein isoform X3 n=1 Tax=Stichopus japonicus TaxID=307972 RepID=UPI003AB240F8